MSDLASAASSSTLPSPPFVNISRIPNLRDIGGYPIAEPTATARSVRRDLVFRSADPSSGDHAALISQLHVGHVFDFRSATEVKGASFGPPMDNVPALTRIWAPFNPEDMSPEAIAERYSNYRYRGDEGFVKAYTDILNSAGPSIGLVLRQLLAISNSEQDVNSKKQAILIHCTAGKDRTAIMTMLLLLLAGCSVETVSREYALTEQGLAPLRSMLVKRAMDRSQSTTDEDRQSIEKMLGSRYEVMPKTIDILNRTWGSARAYIKHECKISDESIEKIKSLLQCAQAPIFDESGTRLPPATGERL